MQLSRKLMVSIGLITFVSLGIAAMHPANDGFKNLQILDKNISEDSLMSIMDNYNVSLGVDCGHCHVMKNAEGKEDYPSDDKHDKKEARDMMRMTDSINREFFPPRNPLRKAMKVTCWTCHHGKAHPERKAP